MSVTTEIRQIPLNQLVECKENVRRKKGTKEEDQELAASLLAKGQLQNLVVRTGATPDTFEVLAGERRWKAFLSNHADGHIDGDHPVNCIVGEFENATEASLAENIQRVSMDPVDEFRAYVAIHDSGKSALQIAQRFGRTEKHIEQRLRLGRVEPSLLDAYQNGAMDLEALEAFTLTDDQARQLEVWRQAKRMFNQAPTIRRLLTAASISTTSKLGRFVGVCAYEKAGGAVRRDLFCDHDEGFLEDAALVHSLAAAKLEKRAKAISKHWKWTEAALEVDMTEISKFDRVYKKETGVPKELSSELETNRTRQDELTNLDEDEWTEELEMESDELQDREEELLREIAKYADYTQEDREKAGCFVTIDAKGSYKYFEGLVRPEDRTAVSKSDKGAATPEKPLSTEEKQRKEAGMGKAHAEDLAAHRQLIAKAHLARAYDVAFDLALYTMCVDCLTTNYYGAPIDLRFQDCSLRSSLNDLADLPAAGVLHKARERLNLSWMEGERAAWFEQLSKLSLKDKKALFAFCVSRSLHGQLGVPRQGDSAIEQAIQRLDIDFAAEWRPTAENYWGRVRKNAALDVAGEVLGANWRQNHEGDKKAVLAEALERAFSGDPAKTATLDPEARERAARWTPPGFAPCLPGDADTAEDDDAASADLPAFLEDDEETDIAA